MKELALHILDIAQNSIVAQATMVEIEVEADVPNDSLSIAVMDNGRGIAPEMLKEIDNPYTTSRTTRKVGMGIPLLKHACEQAGGSLSVQSEVGKGTKLLARLRYGHIDRQPLGDMAGVVVLLVTANPQIEFTYRHTLNGQTYVFDTREVKEVLDGIPINEPEVFGFLKEMLSLNLDEIQIR